ncbi:MAG TPA: hypothetical protein VHP33_18065 [Polyangiaceae bacterium]|nr:hypothetical protein [Polyangiaceae bacterium]
MAASSRTWARAWLAAWTLLAVAACDPDVVIGSKLRTGNAGSGQTAGMGAMAGSAGGSDALGGKAGNVAVGGSTSGDGGMPTVSGAAGEAGAAGQPDDGLLFSADHEIGNLSQWDEGPDADAGGYYADPDAELPSSSTDQAHSGDASAKVQIDTSSGAGVIARLYRRLDLEGAAYYTAWFYLVEDHTPDSWWSIFLFRAVKERNDSIDLWSVDLVRTQDNQLTVAVYDHANAKTIVAPGNPQVPIKQWFQVQAYLEVAPGKPSQLTLWLDGTQFLKLDNTTMVPKDQPLYWVIGNGAAKLTPPVSTLFIDDAQISTSFVRP